MRGFCIFDGLKPTVGNGRPVNPAAAIPDAARSAPARRFLHGVEQPGLADDAAGSIPEAEFSQAIGRTKIIVVGR